MVDWNIRTLVRVFLLVGGVIFIIRGAIEGSSFNLGLGVVAAVLGAFGLWWEWKRRSQHPE